MESLHYFLIITNDIQTIVLQATYLNRKCPRSGTLLPVNNMYPTFEIDYSKSVPLIDVVVVQDRSYVSVRTDKLEVWLSGNQISKICLWAAMDHPDQTSN